MIVPDLLDNLVTNLMVPSSLLRVVNSLLQTCCNKLGKRDGRELDFQDGGCFSR